MKIKLEQLPDYLDKDLVPVYVVHGDEPLLVQEACDAIRAAARRRGCDDRTVLDAAGAFDWNVLRDASRNLSLFTRRRLIELRLPNAKPGAAGGKALVEYAARPAEETLMILSTGKLDKPAMNSEWFKALERAGIALQVWPVTAERLSAWLAGRMRAAGLQPDAAAAALIAARTEGNLLAGVQEIEKLRLLYGSGPLGGEQAAAAVTDSARFNVYVLIDAALAGDAARVARVVNGLRAEGVEATLVLWALARELRALYLMALDCAKGVNIEQVLARHQVWDKRKALARHCLKGYAPAKGRALLHRAARIDRVIKGLEAGAVWDELLQLSCALAGAETAGGVPVTQRWEGVG